MSEAHSFGRYRVTGTLGAGAMGEVFAAVDEVLGREVAVKTLRGQGNGLAARLADERFRLEARAIAALTHPSVVQVFDIDLTSDPPYLVMERVAGPSLKERIRQGPLSEPELRALGIQIANALDAAHARGVVHRDVKPANILAAGAGTWKLADFGVAHVPDSSLTLTGQFVGSPAYAPPEALVRGQLGPEGDVFGLGATLYEAASGEWPRATASTRGLLAAVAPLRGVVPGIAAELAAAIDRAVAVEPAERPSAAELAQLLAAPAPEAPVSASATGSLPAAAGPPPASTLAKAAASYRWKHMVAGIATLLAILLIAVSRCGPSAPSTAISAGPDERGERPSHINAVAPEFQNEEAAKDWRKITDKLRKQQFGEARRKLAEWERDHGETTETRNLASQLDALPAHVLRARERERGRGRDRD